MAKVLVALSGGVDSAVAALLLKREGHDVSAAYMRTWMNEEGGKFFGECPWEDDVANARAVAEKLDIPFRVVDLIEDYREHVVAYLVDGYRRGVTPNPDVLCNREMKFGVFARKAFADGFDFVATGHYARKRVNADGSADILCGNDPGKDQSYFLALLRQEQARRALFPVGHLLKRELRAVAAEAGLPNAARKDSQGICFIGKIRINEFLGQYIPEKPGAVVDLSGKILGGHKGLHRYTIGQRRGIGVPSNADDEHYVVVAKRFEENELVVAFDHPDVPGLYTNESRVKNLSWINRPVTEERELLARVRYRDASTPIVFSPDGHGGARTIYKETHRALASGQIIPLYEPQPPLRGGAFPLRASPNARLTARRRRAAGTRCRAPRMPSRAKRRGRAALFLRNSSPRRARDSRRSPRKACSRFRAYPFLRYARELPRNGTRRLPETRARREFARPRRARP